MKNSFRRNNITNRIHVINNAIHRVNKAVVIIPQINLIKLYETKTSYLILVYNP